MRCDTADTRDSSVHVPSRRISYFIFHISHFTFHISSPPPNAYCTFHHSPSIIHRPHPARPPRSVRVGGASTVFCFHGRAQLGARGSCTSDRTYIQYRQTVQTTTASRGPAAMRQAPSLGKPESFSYRSFPREPGRRNLAGRRV